MLKTFAGKYRTQISRIIRKSRQEKHFLVEYPKKNGQVGKVLFYNNEFRRGTKVESGNLDVIARVFENYGRNIISWAKCTIQPVWRQKNDRHLLEQAGDGLPGLQTAH